MMKFWTEPEISLNEGVIHFIYFQLVTVEVHQHSLGASQSDTSGLIYGGLPSLRFVAAVQLALH